MFKDFKKLFETSFIYGLGSVSGSLIGFFLLPVYTRFLNPAEYGILEILIASSSFIIIFLTFGMDNSFARFYFDSRAIKHRNQVLMTTTIFQWCICSTILFLLLINSDFFSNLLFSTRDYSFMLRLTFLFSGLTVVYNIPAYFNIFFNSLKEKLNFISLIIKL